MQHYEHFFFILQVSQILKKGGRFISVTFSQPHFRKPFLAKSCYDWSISMQTFGDSFHYFFYVMEKGREMCEVDKMLENSIKRKINCDKDKEKRSVSLCTLQEDTVEFLFNIAL